MYEPKIIRNHIVPYLWSSVAFICINVKKLKWQNYPEIILYKCRMNSNLNIFSQSNTLIRRPHCMRSGINSVRNPFIFAWLQIKIREKGERRRNEREGELFHLKLKFLVIMLTLLTEKLLLLFFVSSMRKQKVYIINLLHGRNYRNFIIWHDMLRCRNIWKFLFAIWLPKWFSVRFSPYLFIKNVSVLYLVCVINAMCFRPTLLMGTESKNSFFRKKIEQTCTDIRWKIQWAFRARSTFQK